MTAIAENKANTPFGTIHSASPVLVNTAMALLAGFVIATMLQQVDPRLFNGVNVWEKPAKFFLSLSLHAATLGWGLSLLLDLENFWE